MDAPTLSTRPSVGVQSLAVLSLVFFWVLPFSAFVSLLAVNRTAPFAGWSRRVARMSAFLCCGYTLVLAITVTRLALRWGLAF